MKLPDSRCSRRFVGRGAELAEIAQRLDALSKGEGGAICIIGEPGIGKTSLIAEALALADGRGYRTLSGRAAEFESDMPFGLFLGALDRDVASLGREGLALAEEE